MGEITLSQLTWRPNWLWSTRRVGLCIDTSNPHTQHTGWSVVQKVEIWSTCHSGQMQRTNLGQGSYNPPLTRYHEERVYNKYPLYRLEEQAISSPSPVGQIYACTRQGHCSTIGVMYIIVLSGCNLPTGFVSSDCQTWFELIGLWGVTRIPPDAVAIDNSFKISVGVYEKEDYITTPTYNYPWFLSLLSLCIKLFLPTCHVMPLPQSCAAKSVNCCCLHGWLGAATAVIT